MCTPASRVSPVKSFASRVASGSSSHWQQIDVEEGVSKAPFIKENSCEEEGRAARTPAGAWCIKSRSRRDQPTLTEAVAEAEPRIPYLAAIFALGFLCPLLWFYGWARHSLVKSERERAWWILNLVMSCICLLLGLLGGLFAAFCQIEGSQCKIRH